MLKVFHFDGLELDFDDSKLLMSEALWLEEITGKPIAEIEQSGQRGGMLALAAWLMLAGRRHGHHFKWERLMSANIGEGGDIRLEYVTPPAKSAEVTPDPTEKEEESSAPAPAPTSVARAAKRARPSVKK